MYFILHKQFFNHDVIKWKHLLRYWPFVRGIHRSPVNSPHKGQWRGALMLSLICAWINGWVNNREAGDLRRYRAHYDVSVLHFHQCVQHVAFHCNLCADISVTGSWSFMVYASSSCQIMAVTVFENKRIKEFESLWNPEIDMPLSNRLNILHFNCSVGNDVVICRIYISPLLIPGLWQQRYILM